MMTSVLAAVAAISLFASGVAALIHGAGRIALLEEQMRFVREDLHAEQKNSELQNGVSAALDTRLARMEEKLDMLLLTWRQNWKERDNHA